MPDMDLCITMLPRNWILVLFVNSRPNCCLCSDCAIGLVAFLLFVACPRACVNGVPVTCCTGRAICCQSDLEATQKPFHF